MSNCKYCGQKAGFFKNKHPKCELDYYQGRRDIINNAKKAIINNADFQLLENETMEIAHRSHINKHEIIDLHILGFDKAVDYFLEDGIISKDEEAKIYDFKSHFKYEQDNLNRNNSIFKVVKGSILRDVFDGIIPEQRIDLNGQLPILFQKNESIIWIFYLVSYYEQKTRTEYQGGSQGVSVRIAKGLYYRVSAFKGNAIKTEEMSFKAIGR